MSTEIVRIARERDAEAVALFTDAFAHDEHFRRFFADTGAGFLERVAGMFAAGCVDQRRLGMRFLGATRGDTVSGIATVLEPSRYRHPPWPVRAWHRLRWRLMARRLGVVTWRRLNAYRRACAWFVPPGPCTYVAYLGVRPAAQRNGIGHRLLDAIYALACADSLSHGVLLHTVNARLAASLERDGWHVLAQSTAGGLTAHTCFRACPAPERE